MNELADSRADVLLLGFVQRDSRRPRSRALEGCRYDRREVLLCGAQAKPPASVAVAVAEKRLAEATEFGTRAELPTERRVLARRLVAAFGESRNCS